MDTELQEILQSLDANDLTSILSSQNVKANELGALSLEDLDKFGIASERAQQFLGEVQKEDRRKQSLHQKLKEIHCEELFNFLMKTGCKAEDVSSLDDGAIKSSGLSFLSRKEVLEKIQKDNKIKGS